MAPLLTLTVVTALMWTAGRLTRRWDATLHAALRGGLLAMFLVTGASHFIGMRQDLIAMVPPALPSPGLLVTITGVLELAGALAMLHRRTAPWGALGLAALLVAMFPANAYAALEGLELGGEPAMALLPRLILQLVFLAASLTVATPLRQKLRFRDRHESARSTTSSAVS